MTRRHESQAEESNPDNEEAEMVVRDTVMIASMKNLIEEALNNQNIQIKDLISEAVKEAVIPLQLEIVDLKENLKKSEFAIAETTVKLDNLEQTNRRNNLRIEGFPEMKEENTDQNVL